MAAKDWYLGDATAVGITIQAPATNNSWDGAAHTLRYFRPMQGGAGMTIGFEHTPLATLDADPVAFSKGGRRVNGNFSLPLVYAYQEGLIRGAFGTASYSPTGGGAAASNHPLTLGNRVLYCTLVYYWENYKGIKFQVLVNNAMITQLTINQEHGSRPTLDGSWVGQTPTASTPGAAPTLASVQYPDWEECTLKINNNTIVHDSFSFDISQPAVEDDYGISSDEDPDAVFIGRSDQRAITFNLTGGLDDVIAGIIEGGTAVAADNTITWDNAGATTDNRKVVIDRGQLLPQASDQPRGDFARLKTSMSFLCQSTTASPISITTTNALAVAEPPTV
jgi:hypothetical protein